MLIREAKGCRDNRETVRNNRAALRQDPGSASRDAQNSLFEFLFRIKISNKWKMLATGEQ